MSSLRSLRIIDHNASAAMHNELLRDPRLVVKPRKVRKKPERAEAWQQRRQAYLIETGKTEKTA